MKTETRALIIERRWYALGFVGTVGLQMSVEWGMRIGLIAHATVWAAIVYGITRFIAELKSDK